MEEELAPLTAQLAFIAGRQGKSHAAVEAYHSLLDPSRELQLDAATAAVATHNLAAENYLAESYQAAKKAFTSYLKKLDGLFAREDLLALKAELEGRLSRWVMPGAVGLLWRGCMHGLGVAACRMLCAGGAPGLLGDAWD